MGRKHTSWVYQLIRLDPESKQRYCTLCPAESGSLKCGNNEKNRANTTNLEYHLMKHHEDIAKDVKQRHKEEVSRSTAMKKRHLGAKEAIRVTVDENLWQAKRSRTKTASVILVGLRRTIRGF